ncbi:MAG: inositol monophosphatase, partial [Chthoniobacterales bacterium]|nr:inositol monophosphatase [Chthoniobacterales bacterium]
MHRESLESLTQLAAEAVRAAGGLIMANFSAEHSVSASEAHDIKIELDRRVQDLLEHILVAHLPHYSVLGEEGIRGSEGSENEWILDPIDGTVNYFYGIPHFCVSVALRRAGELVL